MREELNQKLAQAQLGETEYNEDSFVKMTMKYPRSWQVSHWEDGIKFASADGKEYFSVFVQKMGHPVPEEAITTTEFYNYAARRLTDTDQKTGDNKYDVLEIYPHGLNNHSGVIELQGDQKNFDKFLGWVSEFSVSK